MSRLILVADQDGEDRSSLCSALEGAGFRTVGAGDCAEAVRIVREQGPDAAVLNVSLPGGGAVQACRRIQDMRERRGTPILVCTVGGTVEHLNAALSGLVTEFLLKPVDVEDLAAKLRRVLPERREKRSDRRGDVRCDVRLSMVAVTAGVGGGTVALTSEVFNISSGGLAFHYVPVPPVGLYAYEPDTIGPLHPLYRYSERNPRGESVRLVLAIPGQETVRALGKVVYARPSEEGEICGVCFTGLRKEDRRRITALVASELRRGVGAGPGREEEPAAEPPRSAPRVVVAEEEESVRTLLCRALSENGYDVTPGSDGWEAVALAGSIRPCLLLMDLQMAGMGDLAAVRAVRADPNLGEVAIIVLSTFVTPGMVQALRREGIAHVVNKEEANLPELLNTVREECPIAAVAPGRPAEKKRRRVPGKKKKGVPCAGRLKKKLDAVASLRALPVVLSQILRLTASATSSVKDLAETLERDQALTARLLKLANSPLYGLPRRIGTVRQAVSLIGFNGIRKMAVAARLIDEYRKGSRRAGLDRVEFWRHSLACGVLARDLARSAALPPEEVEEAFVAGLLHDIGKVILDEYFPADYGPVLREAAKEEKPLHVAESAKLGLDHTDVARLVLGNWRFPARLVAPIVRHHASWRKIHSGRGGSPKLCGAVRVADVLANACGIGRGGNDVLEDIHDSVSGALGMDRKAVGPVVRSLDGLVGELAEILSIGSGDPRPAAAGAVPGRPAVFLHERRPLVDPFEILLERSGCDVRLAERAGDGVEAGETLVLRASSPRWLSSRVGRMGKTGAPDGKVVVLSDAPVGPENRARLRDLGAAVIEKPYSMPEVVRACV
ncbi:MAG: HDOD domain-containing protein [Planctomycetota bacterium]|jgi:putative nucleotidyltransferase with HDIG domain